LDAIIGYSACITAGRSRRRLLKVLERGFKVCSCVRLNAEPEARRTPIDWIEVAVLERVDRFPRTCEESLGWAPVERVNILRSGVPKHERGVLGIQPKPKTPPSSC
jgi:hypothetical protein